MTIEPSPQPVPQQDVVTNLPTNRFGPENDASLLTHSPQGWFSTAIDWLVDSFGSILVKESRQAIKSMQFLGTFSLLILAVIIWTVIMLTYQLRSSADGFSRDLFCGYLVVLGLPLGVIVPFSAFRSLAREYEDGTIQLISITTMRPHQIVLGKLGTAMLQMVIYLSVVAPCIAFLSFLDGVTLTQIVIGIGIAIIGCICLTNLGLLLAGATRRSAITLAISTLFILGLGGLFIAWVNFVWEVLASEFRNTESFFDLFSVVCFQVVAFLLSTTLIMLAAAASQISFPTDNRSTLPRLAMLFQLIFFFGSVVMVAYFLSVEPMFYLIYLVFIGHYWMLMGFMLVGESGDISRRVLRGMPRTVLGRSFRSLLMPGPGRGYLFAMACMFSCATVVLIVVLFSKSFIMNESSWAQQFAGPWGVIPGQLSGPGHLKALLIQFVVILAYPSLFISTTYLLMTLYRRSAKRRLTGASGPFFGLVLGGLLTLAITLVSNYYSYRSYSNRTNLEFWESWSWYEVVRQTSVTFHDTMATPVGFDYQGAAVRFFMNCYWVIPVLGVSMVVTSVAFLIASREFMFGVLETPDRVSDDIQQQISRTDEPEESIDEALGIDSSNLNSQE